MTFRAAFAEIDITPTVLLPLAGMPNAPVAQGTQWPLYGRVAVFDDGDRRIAIVIADLLALDRQVVSALREGARAAGIDRECVLVSCTHTHRGPFTKPGMDVDRDDTYLKFACARISKAIVSCSERLVPAELVTGCVAAPGWAFNRRPVYRGGEVGTHGPEWVEEFERREGPADDELQVVLARTLCGDEIIGGLVNFACHPTALALDPVYSADYPGPLTEALAGRHGGIFAFLQGACGDVSPADMSAPGAARSGFAFAHAMGASLAEASDRAILSSRVVESPQIHVASTQLEIDQRRPSSDQVRLARWYLEEAGSNVDEDAFTEAIYGHRHTFYGNSSEIQRWFTRETIGMWEWQRRSGAHRPTDIVEIQALALGNVVFVTFPGELFSEFGIAIKHASPFPTTVVCELANGYVGYIPTENAFAQGGYEPRLAYSSRLVPDAGDKMTSAALELIARVHHGTM